MLQIGRREQLIILVILTVVLFGGGYRYAQYKAGAVDDQPALVSAPEETAVQGDANPQEIVVHVSGEVEKPGVYTLQLGDRVIDAIEMAQPKVDADLDILNLAAPLTDGQKIPVPPKIELTAVQGETTPNGNASPFVSQMGSQTSGLVNLNTADVAALDTLPGIGPALAQRIIDYRQANGGFKSVEDLKNVSGIGDKKYEDLKEMISIY